LHRHFVSEETTSGFGATFALFRRRRQTVVGRWTALRLGSGVRYVALD
jgi:hypothetical protein